ncbi:hypothetical protein PIB30_011998 [Stylosanthes scabra]|uniref:Uncharacterized protein n=1 Tax=Stylosanthes scabra TaxID=79078 RepID=A0ABU6Y5F9_9FABA|nr:hypothetical protein [Stylosanthes scabra]
MTPQLKWRTQTSFRWFGSKSAEELHNSWVPYRSHNGQLESVSSTLADSVRLGQPNQRKGVRVHRFKRRRATSSGPLGIRTNQSSHKRRSSHQKPRVKLPLHLIDFIG